MKKALLFVIGLMLTSTLLAGPVGKEEAKAKALTFLTGKVGTGDGRAKAPLQEEQLSLATTGDAYHVFNIGSDGGFVIVSASDLTPDIIGYTDEGTFDANNIPDNMKAWLQEYANQIAWVEKNGEQVTESKVRKAPAVMKTSIAPMIQTKWGQGAPYNYLCPQKGSDFCVTGCVATALAQILYYHNQTEYFPESTEHDIPAYTKGIAVPACPASSFDWTNMQLTYTGEEATDNTQALAVAKLMQYCGAAVKMKYGTSSSSASSSDMLNAMKDYFGYDERVKLCYRSKYMTNEWENLIYQELAANRPVLYSGASTGGAHAFVCDGYSEDGFFHINWGWKGKGDGYYLLNVVNPHEKGVGSGSSNDGYTLLQDILIGIENPVGPVPVEVEEGQMTINGITYSGAASLEKNASTNIAVQCAIYNLLETTHVFQYGIGLFDENGVMIQLPTGIKKTLSLDPNYGYSSTTLNSTFDFSGLEDGKTYTIRAVSRFDGEADWLKCKKSGIYYLKLEANSSNVTVSAVSNKVDLDVQLDVSPLTCIKGEFTELTATITNKGSDFNGALYLFVNGISEPLSSNGISVEVGKKTQAYFAFKYEGEAPAVKGIQITTDEAGTNVIWDGYMNTQAGVAGDDTPTLTFSTKLNVDGNKILGKKLIGVVTATNSTSNNYTGEIDLVCYKWEGLSGKGTYTPQTFNVPAGKSVNITYEYDVVFDGKYSVAIQYAQGGGMVEKNETLNDYYYAKPAIKVIANDGSETLTLPTTSFDVPSSAVVVDMRELSTIPTTINENSNPNCLYLFASSASVPESLLDNNVVKGTTAANIVLADGYDYYTPIDFTATKISYTRTFTTGADKTTGGGWNTIVLPFDVTYVKKGADLIDWFHSSSDTGKNFWLFGFESDTETNVDFNYIDAIKANTPYLINVPDATWGTNKLTDVPITFEGKNVLIKANAKSAKSAPHFIFSGGIRKRTVSQGYVLNAAGTEFVKTTTAVEIPAYQAYFYATSRGWLADALVIGFVDNNEATAILSLDSEEQTTGVAEGWYTLQGVKLEGKPTEKGIYIYNGKKVAIK